MHFSLGLCRALSVKPSKNILYSLYIYYGNQNYPICQTSFETDFHIVSYIFALFS